MYKNFKWMHFFPPPTLTGESDPPTPRPFDKWHPPAVWPGRQSGCHYNGQRCQLYCSLSPLWSGGSAPGHAWGGGGGARAWPRYSHWATQWCWCTAASGGWSELWTTTSPPLQVLLNITTLHRLIHFSFLSITSYLHYQAQSTD